jgi:NTP pyrophosphatase (non-canonical NTP hydrolase)
MLHPHVTVLADRAMTARRITDQAAAARTAPRRQSRPLTLPGLAEAINTACLDAGFPQATLPAQQVLCLAEETGEFTGAYRRWAGLARRTGTWDDMTAELADVVIAAYTTARALGIDLDAAWHAKAAVILTRGWRQPPPTAA